MCLKGRVFGRQPIKEILVLLMGRGTSIARRRLASPIIPLMPSRFNTDFCSDLASPKA